MATTSYITPIMDRKQSDIEYAREHQNDLVNKNKGAWNYTDLNRICNNLKYAAEYMYDQGFLSQPYQMSVKTDWTETDIITYEQLQSMIVVNLNGLKAYSRDDLNWYPITSIANLDYSLANYIEKNIDQLATQLPIPADTYELSIEDGTGGGYYEARTVVNIQANPAPAGMAFDHWSGDHLENIGSATAAITTYTMPNQNIRLKANYTGTVPHTLTIVTNSGTTTSSLLMGAIAPIEADPAPEGKVFHHWIVSPSQYEENLYEPAASTHFTMPNEAVTLTAFYITKGDKQLIVQNGNGSGYYEYGTYAAVSSTRPANTEFTNWSGDTQYLTGPATQEYNSVLIPDVNRITIRANWRKIPATNIQVTVVNGIIASTGESTGVFTEDDRLTIVANEATQGNTFDIWSKTGGGSIPNNKPSTTTFVVGSTDATITANYRPLVYHTLTVITDSGTDISTKEQGEYFTVDANPIPNGYTFDRWTGDTNSYPSPNDAWFNPNRIITGTYMGTADRTITANYRPINAYTLTVRQLSGDVTYTQDEFTTLSVTAENAPVGKAFTGWSVSGGGRISSNTAQTITYTFSNSNCTLTPNYVNIWDITVIGGTINGRSNATLREGETYRLQTRDLAVYEQLTSWTHTGPGTITNTAAPITYYTVGNGDDTITANITQYPDKTLTIYFRDPDTEVDTLISTRTYTYGTTITGITAEVAPDQTTFLTWLGDVNILSPSALASTVTIQNLTADTTIIATYYYPEAPEYYTLTVYDGYGGGTYATGSQIPITANTPNQGWEFYEWYGDTQYLVNPDLSLTENSVIMPAQAISLHAKYNVIGELPLYRVSVSNGTVWGQYEDSLHNIHRVPSSGTSQYIDVPEGAQVTLVADPDTISRKFDYWDGNFTQAGVIDLNTRLRSSPFTMVKADINAQAITTNKELASVHMTNGAGAGVDIPPTTYTIYGTLVNTENIHYDFTHWTCVDIDGHNQISKIANPLLETTTITLDEGDELWVEAHYTTNYKLTVSGGQDIGDGYYYEGETVNTVYANNAPTGMMFNCWLDPTGVIDTVNSNIYDPTPIIIMKDSPALITADFVSTDINVNSIGITGDNMHNNLITKANTQLVNGIYAVGTIIFDRDGCIGIITNTDPDNNDNTDLCSVQKLFYGGNF